MPVPVCAAAAARAICRQEVPASNIHTEQSCTAQYRGAELGTGQLFVAETDIVWIRDGDDLGFRLQYKRLIAHAVSKDLTAYPRPCVYMLYEAGAGEGDQEESDDEEEGGGNIEIRIAPQTDNTVQRIYEAISDGQLLHPDEQSDSDDEGSGLCPEDMQQTGGLGFSSQIRFDSDGQLLVDNQAEMMEDQDDDGARYEDMEED